jgi:hypothetical protein
MPTTCRVLPLVLFSAALLAGCSPYYSVPFYRPRPLTTEITLGGDDRAAPLRVFSTIVGLRRPDSKANLPASVEMRFLVENNSQQPARVDPTSFRLMDALLQTLDPPISEPAGPIEIAPGQSTTIPVYFPLTGNRDPQGHETQSFTLHWAIDLGGQHLTRVATFYRPAIYHYYDDPYYGGPYGYVGGGYPYGWWGGGAFVH